MTLKVVAMAVNKNGLLIDSFFIYRFASNSNNYIVFEIFMLTFEVHIFNTRLSQSVYKIILITRG